MDLKPCPFCGGEIKVYIGINNLRFFRCENCGAIVSFDNDYCNNNPKNAYEYWNRRADNG